MSAPRAWIIMRTVPLDWREGDRHDEYYVTWGRRAEWSRDQRDATRFRSSPDLLLQRMVAIGIWASAMPVDDLPSSTVTQEGSR